MLTTYQTDGVRTDYTFDWPYLDRAHIMVTEDTAPRAFKFIDDHTIRVVTIFGDPLPKGRVLKIFRVTPDLVSFAEFKDAANLTADDLNRARLQVLFLVQERSGGLGGSVAAAVQIVVNEINTISGALDSLSVTQGVLTSGLQTLNTLAGRLTVVENGADALHQQILKEIADRDEAGSVLASRMDKLEIDQDNMKASVSSDINLLKTQSSVLASKTDTISARLDGVVNDSKGGAGNTGDDDILAASIITSAVAEAKINHALAKRVDILAAKVNGDMAAMIQTEQTARVSADDALARQITTLQAQIGENIAQVIQDMKTTVESVDGKVTNLNAQYTLKAQVRRDDGRMVMAGVALAATANNDLSKSEIVMMADRLVFADPSSVNGPLKPIFTSGNVDGSPTMVIPSNVMGDRMYPGRLLVDGTIEGRSIKANEITGDKIVAGTLTAREVNVNFGGNLVPNASMVDVFNGFPTGWTYWNGMSGASMGFGDSTGFESWFPLNSRGIVISQTGVTGSGSYALAYSNQFTVEDGKDYEFSVYTGAHRCTVGVLIEFFNSAGTSIGTSFGDTNTAQLNAGKTVADFKRVGAITRAPSGASAARLLCAKYDTYARQADSFGFFMRPMVAEASANQTRLSPYKESGLGTKITPGGISTPTLSAISATIGVLRTATSGARTEIQDNLIRVFDHNNVMRVRIGVW
ncbi:hypothetical protein RSP795_10195 [Ralstonia solanacearum]|uniref:phage tail fiber domain-containing protein n=1 Tax=Ralstonia solanacearum TaxID=305 RepID=UPI0007D871C8|nr:phage tail fiber protein [Ralstonia solanacearum]OAI62801.1 hypothetical protein RSP795_10195 [Ralstonia solanacearum]